MVFWDLLVRESFAIPWREVLWALRRLEARGTARGGRFVTGFAGEQYALPEAIDLLRSTRRRDAEDPPISLSAADPLNLAGIILPGPRVAAVGVNRVMFGEVQEPAGVPELAALRS